MRPLPHLFSALPLLLLAPACKKAPVTEPVVEAAPPACGPQPDGTRRFRILHLNDVYRIDGLADGRGGLARVRTLRKEAEQGCEDDVLLTHAGDALYPSLLSRTFDGAQMVGVLNALDGDADAMDPRMLFTFGNHEFDADDLDDAPTLQARIDESQWRWLDTNLAWAQGADGAAIASDKLHSQVIVELGGVKVGVFGMTLDSKQPAYVSYIDTDYVGVARSRTLDLRERGAEVVVALTHLNATDDQRLLRELGRDGPDLVLGGHDHVLQTHTVGAGAVLKGDADAVRVRRVEVVVGDTGVATITWEPEGVALGPEAPARDPQVQSIVDDWQARFAEDFCSEEDPECLDTPLTVAGTDLHAEETVIRRFETNLGDWIVDEALGVFEGEGVDAAFVNSGALRLNQDIAAGTPITRRSVEELFAYPASLHLVQVSGSTLQAVLEHSVEDWTASGHWLQVAGLAFRHDPAAESVRDVTILGPDGPRPLDPEATYRVATVRYLLDPSIGDQDGYDMLSLDDEVETPHTGTDLKGVVMEALAGMGDGGLTPEREGRICGPQRPGSCLAIGD